MSGLAFVSYSRDDSAFALRLAQDLKAAGAKVWLDQLDINPGTSWDNAIEDALDEATHLLIILSPASSRSTNVRNEISYAQGQGKIVIPVFYTECQVPLQLHRCQRIDFRQDYACGLTTLVNQLQGSQTLTGSQPGPSAPHPRSLDLPKTPPNSASGTRKAWWMNAAIPISLAGLLVIAAGASAAMWVHHGRTPEALYQKALTESELKDDAAAAALHKQACKAGYARSCTALAQLYETGKLGSPKEHGIELAAWYDAGCTYGDYVACAALGKLYYIGGEVSKDVDQAFKYDQMACTNKNFAACSQLGILYIRGEGTDRDTAKAMELFKTACDGKDALGCSALGKHYADGTFIVKDEKKAAAADQTACNEGHASSCSRLADLYRTGEGVKQNSYFAKQLYQKACLDGDEKACDAWLDPPTDAAPKP